MKDDAQKPVKESRDALLGELESIKELLDQYQEESAESNIPLLNEVVQDASPKNSTDDPQLLDLDNIFGDSDDLVLDGGTSNNDDKGSSLDDLDELDIGISIPEFTLHTTVQEEPSVAKAEQQVADSTPPSPSPAGSNSNPPPSINIDLLIQEIVDESIPALEAQLRERLSQHSIPALKQILAKLNKT